MSTQHVMDFLNAVTTGHELQQELHAAVAGSEATGEAIAMVARRHGHEFDVSELTEVVTAINAAASGELTDEELESVAGGFKVENVSSNQVKLGMKLSSMKLGTALLDPTNFGSFSG